MYEFSSMQEFAEHLDTMVPAEVTAQHAGLERGAKIIEYAAKAEIGHYQDAAGPFAAWPELAASTKDDRVRKGFSENEPGLRSGEMGASIGHVVDHHEAVIGSDDDNLVYFELGTSRQPPRSVLGAAAFRNGEKVARAVGEEVVIALVGADVFGGRMEIE